MEKAYEATAFVARFFCAYALFWCGAERVFGVCLSVRGPFSFSK